MSKKTKKWIIIVICLIAIVAIILLLFRKSNGEVGYNTTTIHKDKIEITVTATGYVQPVDKVDVGTQVSGVVEKIYVDFNSNVKKGDLLAELDCIFR